MLSLARIHRRLLLNDRGILKAMKEERIRVTPEITDDQIQPSTLDIRIGEVKVYGLEEMALGVESLERANSEHVNQAERTRALGIGIPNIAAFDYEPTDEHALVYPDEKDIPIRIPSKSFAEIKPHESVSCSFDEYTLQVDLRSSRGRLGLTLQPNYQRFSEDSVISIFNNNPNDIILYGQSKFAQLFFYPQHEGISHNGHVVDNASEAKRLLPELKKRITSEGYVVFTPTDFAYRFKRDLGVIDTNKKYGDAELYDIVKRGQPFELGDVPIIPLVPRLQLPPHVGIALQSQIPYEHPSGLERPNLELLLLDHHCVNASWVDPGFKGRVTAHVYRRKFPLVLRRDVPVALGVVYRYDKSCNRAYGSKSLKSHYQGSKGEGSKS